MKLLDTNGGNLKLKKTEKSFEEYRLAGLSMMPNYRLCPGSKAADCMTDCLKSSGLAGVYKTVNEARQRKTDYFESNQTEFLKQLVKELSNFEKLCSKQGKKGAVRLNVLSDVNWEKLGIPQQFPNLFFYDYTKRAARLNSVDMPSNYKLMFSYSGSPKYQSQVKLAEKTDAPIAVVFKCKKLPKTFMGREVVDGDESDLKNVLAGKVIIGLKAKGKARKSNSSFIVEV